MATKVFLIRHGKTNYNLKKRYCGFTDIGINSIGRQEAEELKRRLKNIKIDRIITSDLKRSIQTAQIIFKGRHLKIIKNKNLREINFGAWEGLNFRQLVKTYPVYREWLKDPHLVPIPGGEKMSGFIKRIRKEVGRIVSNNHGKTVAIVSHFGVMRLILNDALGIKRKDFWQIKLQDKKIYIIEYNPRWAR